MNDESQGNDAMDTGDEPLCNRSRNEHFAEVIARRMSRRSMLSGSLSAAVTGVLGATMLESAEASVNFLPPAAGGRPPHALNPTLGFEAIPVSRSDTAVLPRGYRAQVLLPWGEPLTGTYPAYKPDGTNTGAEQEQQVGSHHDGMHFFPMAGNPDSHGLLCLNHEYVDQQVLHAGGAQSVGGRRVTDQVRKEIAAHGVSVAEIKRENGQWQLVRGAYNRRVTANTPMEIRGPVRGSDFVRTKYSPAGTLTRGTINNCAHGYTPWNTYLTCEENWAGYFSNLIQRTRIDALFDKLYGPGGTKAQQGAYYTRYYASTNTIYGVIDETVDQKQTSNLYRASGDTINAGNRIFIGELVALLAANGIDIRLPREQARYGVRTSTSRYGWETAQSGEDQYVRFDATIKGASATDDYRNEPNGQGWVVEIDPFDPTSVPKKRTALGRFAHEGAWLAPVQQGQPVVFYMGDDAQSEYIYKFVTRARWSPGLKGDVLDEGTLYVARFDDDGTGEWLPLDIRDAGFRAAVAEAGLEFRDQADVLVNTRTAADCAGATMMDRPEWGAVHPQTREVYMTLTNNSSRPANNTDASNPRGPNPFGHIIRWREQGNRPWATKFEWDLFALAGPANDSQVLPARNGPALDSTNIFASPDGLWIDQFGTLWIQTDMSGSQQATGPFGENAMLAANPRTGEIKRFLSGPKDQETTGVVSTPNGRSLFVNFQHPGDRSNPANPAVGFTSNWPAVVYRNAGDPVVVASPAGPRPRSGTIVVSREDGGIVGL